MAQGNEVLKVPEMVERVARAIYEKRNGAGCKPWSIQPKAHREPYYGDARAAIEAMREPTDRMKFDGAMTLPDYDPGSEDSQLCWETMIDTALNPRTD